MKQPQEVLQTAIHDTFNNGKHDEALQEQHQERRLLLGYQQRSDTEAAVFVFGCAVRHDIEQRSTAAGESLALLGQPTPTS